MPKIVLLRHGQSIWNLENRFTGWVDVDLSAQGINEAINAGRVLKKEEYCFDVAYTSVLKRAIRTLWIVLDEMDLMWIPVYNTWRLNERHYGTLQGLNKQKTTIKHGLEQVQLWRRSYDVPPPGLDKNDARYPGFDRRYLDVKEDELPASESLKETLGRVLPYRHGTVAPAIMEGKRILISAHGNSLRALVKYLDNISDKDIVNLNIPTGFPLVYELDDNLKAKGHYYLGSQEEIKKATESVKKQISHK